MWNDIFLFVGIAGVYKLLYSLYRYGKDSLFFILALFMSFTLWYVIPILLSNCGYWYIFDAMVKISLEDFNSYVIYEVYFYLFILWAYCKIRKYKFKSIIVLEEGGRIKSKEGFFIAYSVLMILYRTLKDVDYSEANDLGNANNGIMFLLSFFGTYIISYYYVNIFNQSHNKRCKLFLFLIIASVTQAVIMGARIYLLVFIWLYFMKNWNYILERKYFRFFFPVILLLISFSLLLPIMATKRTGSNLSKSDLEASGELVLFHLNLKLNSFAYSTALIEYDGEGFAGYTPYVGSLLKYLPRAIWKSKPTPLSYDGSVEGTPTRRIPMLLDFQDTDTANVGVSTFLVSLWQGWGYVFIALIVNIFYLLLVSSFLRHNSFYIKAIGFYLLCFPQLIATPSSGDNLIQRLLEVPILLLFLYLLGIIRFKYVYGQ
ncbi:hypothetical protein [uncultured Bacteroides sp.]|uniref:hypothetical protein n=1 Tax=uncultured Bacteroides sp. TaxID=162156 RepID=UPI00261401FD|nr:hypothetical protein [uncultured Bacteroides sp.]